MNTKLLLCLFIIAGFCSCSTAYRSGQTPDDVYYSPAPPQNNYVKQDNDKDKNVYTSSTEDIQIRSRIHNRRWRQYDNYGFDYYYYDYRYPVYVNPKYKYTSTQNNYIQPRKFNLGGYTPTGNTTLSNLKSGNQNNTTTNAPIRTFKTDNSNTNNGTGVGNFIRKVFAGDNNYNRSNDNSTPKYDNSTPTRTFDNSRSTNSNTNTNSNSNSGSSNSGSSGSGSSGNAPVRSFPK